MNKKKVVIALGHVTLGTTLPEQMKGALKAAKVIADIIQNGYQVVISHSNAPQVGMIHTAMNEFQNVHKDYTAVPISVCSAMSQGYIGYDLQNAIRTELIKRGIYKTVSTILTQVTVDPYDEAFSTPVKIIGRYLTAKEAKAEEEKGNNVAEVPGRGYRRIVAAPKPLEIVEIDAIKLLSDADQVVIAGGGGGIPVLEQGCRLKGASAVIEKDFTSGKLAEQLHADILLFLTNVEHAFLDYGSEKAAPIGILSVEEAKKYMKEKQFGFDSMLPKIEASVEFVSGGKDRMGIITSPDHALNGLLQKTGTIIK